MDGDPYAPPRAVVADLPPEPRPVGPWQVTWAIRLCWLQSLLTMPDVVESMFSRAPAGVSRSLYLGIMAAAYLPLFSLFFVLYVLMARGYRWARVVYAALILLGFLAMFRSVPYAFARAAYLGVLNIVVGLMGAATLWLLFARPANAWFRTRGGRLAPP